VKSIEQKSVLSIFLKREINAKLLSVKKFAKKFGISEKSVYKLLSVKRKIKFLDEAFYKIVTALELTEEKRKYILNLASRERESGKIIYHSESAPLLELLPSEPSSVEVEPVKELKKEHIISAPFSILSSFLKQKFLATGLSVKKFTEKSGISERTVYRFLYVKRDFKFSDEMLNKIATGLELTEEDRKYILDLADSVRKERGEIIYPSKSVILPELLSSEPSLPEPVPLPSEPLLSPSPSESSSIEVEPVKELKMEQSIHISFLQQKFLEKGLSVKKFAEKAGISERSIYKLLSVKRDCNFLDDTLNKIATGLELTEEDKKYILDLAARERENGKIIYPSESSPLQELLPSESSSIEVEPVKELKKEHITSAPFSILSSFLKQKFSAIGLSVKKFAEKTGISKRTAYNFFSVKKDFQFSDEMLKKMAIGLKLTEEDRIYILNLAANVRKKRGEIIYLSESVIPPELSSSEPSLSETVSLPSEPLLLPSLSESSSIEVEPVKELKMEQSIHISFLQQKFLATGLSVKKFAEKAGISERSIYKLLSVKRDFNFLDDTLNKIATGLEFTEEDKKYILDLAARERESGKIIYPSESLPLPELSSPESSLSEPVSLPTEPVLPSSSSEPSSIEVEPVKELKKERIISAPFSILSSFLQQKFSATGLSVNKFTEKAGISERTVYRFLYVKKDFKFSDDTLNKIASGLELPEEDRKYILDLADSVRKERGEIIYPSESVIPPELLSSESLPEPVSLPSEPLLPPSPSESSLIKVDPAICPLNILEEETGLFPLSEILIPEQFIKTPPGRWKIEETIAYYKKHGNFDKPIKVNRNTMMLTDGYKRYVAAKELGLTEIQVQFVGKEKQVSTIKTEVIEEPSFKKLVLVEGEEFCSLSEILIPEQFIKTPPGRGKIEETISYYNKHGEFDKPIKVNKHTMMLTDGYKRYVAAKELGLTEIQVQFVGKEKQVSTIKKEVIEVIEEPLSKKSVLVDGEEICLLSEIIIPKIFQLPPGKKNIDKSITFFMKHGRFPNSIIINKENKNLIEGYKYYMAAKELGLIEIAVKSIEKEKTKPPDAVKSIDKEKTKASGLDFCQLSEIIIPDQFVKAYPGREKIEAIISSYRKHGKFDNPIKVIKQIILVDGYKRYVVAKELGLTEIEVKFIATPVQETIKPSRREEKKELPTPTKKVTKPVILPIAKNLKGSIKKLFPGKGYGFINGDDREAYFFHQSGLMGIDIDELDLEYRVTFDLIEGLKGPNAVNIREDVNV
jgi:transcriptional regulator with XRE-family HTH domain/cold shock CspA family protein